MTTHTGESCLEAAKRPGLEPGDEVERGKFWRNLRGQDLKKFVAGDSSTDPVHGRRVTPHQWGWKPQHSRDGLSVNSPECCSSAACSLLLQGDAELLHIAEFELGEFARAIGIDLVAIWDPLPANPCHYCIVAAEGNMLDMYMRIKERLKELFAFQTPPRPPTDEVEIATLRRNIIAHNLLFTVYPDVAESRGA